MIGTLVISNGRVIWKDPNKGNGYKMAWEDLAKLMERDGEPM